MTESRFIVYKESSLHYIKAGSGAEPLLFFHGFGQDHSIYLPIIRGLADRYSIYVFDLFFHGQSEWRRNEEPLEKSFWKEIMIRFLKENALENFSVAGFSLGGKFVLATLEAFPERCKNVFLIAPDGIKTSFWYSMATYPVFLRRFFKSMIGRYNRFAAIAAFLNRLKLVDKGLIRFADYQMNSEAKRSRVYYSWVVFRLLKFDLKKIGSLITRYQMKLVIIVGRYDGVIVADDMQRLTKFVPGAKVHILDTGHSGLINADNLRKFFL